MRRLTRAAIVAMSAGTILTGCAYGSGANGGGSGPASAPANPPCLPGDNGYSWCSSVPNNQQPTKPIVSADANTINHPECQLDYYTPTLIGGGLIVQGVFAIRCTKSPTVILVTARLQYRNTAGNWVDETNLYVTTTPPLPGVPQGHQLQAACYPGAWRLEGHWNGIKSDGKTPFPNPADGDTPNDWVSQTVRFSC